MNLCYILDGVLILYGIILTVLYCRLRIHSVKKQSQAKNQPAEGAIYAVRLLILKLKKTLKMAHERKVTAYCTVDGIDITNI